jgi:hypothetical protein
MARKKVKKITREPSTRFVRFTVWLVENEKVLKDIDSRGSRRLVRLYECNDLQERTLDMALKNATFQWESYEGMTKPRW